MTARVPCRQDAFVGLPSVAVLRSSQDVLGAMAVLCFSGGPQLGHPPIGQPDGRAYAAHLFGVDVFVDALIEHLA